MKSHFRILILAMALLVAWVSARAEYPSYTDNDPFSTYYIGLGLAGSQFDRNSVSAKNITFSSDPNDHVIGGSFDGMESSIRASITTNIDRESNFLLPISYEYQFLRAGEMLYYNLTPELQYYGTFKHQIDVHKLSIGGEWQFLATEFRDVKFYMGMDLKSYFITAQDFIREDTKIVGNDDVIIEKFPYKPKEDALRFGGEVKLGIRGHLLGNFYINAFVGYESWNAIGRDNNRGQLLTPFSRTEVSENYVGAFHYFIGLEYKL